MDGPIKLKKRNENDINKNTLDLETTTCFVKKNAYSVLYYNVKKGQGRSVGMGVDLQFPGLLQGTSFHPSLVRSIYSRGLGLGLKGELFLQSNYSA